MSAISQAVQAITDLEIAAGKCEELNKEYKKVSAKARRLHHDMLEIRKITVRHMANSADYLNALAEIEEIADDTLAVVEGK